MNNMILSSSLKKRNVSFLSFDRKGEKLLKLAVTVPPPGLLKDLKNYYNSKLDLLKKNFFF